MEKEEILAQAQKENKKKDLADQEATNIGFVWGGCAAVILAAIFMALSIILTGKTNSGFMAVAFITSAFVFWVKYIKLHKKHELVAAILYSLLTVSCIILHIIMLVDSSTIL